MSNYNSLVNYQRGTFRYLSDDNPVPVKISSCPEYNYDEQMQGFVSDYCMRTHKNCCSSSMYMYPAYDFPNSPFCEKSCDESGVGINNGMGCTCKKNPNSYQVPQAPRQNGCSRGAF